MRTVITDIQQKWLERIESVVLQEKRPLPVFSPLEENDIFNLLDKHLCQGSKLLIIDDMDFDGTGAGYIAYQYLKNLNSNMNITIIHNKEHGVKPEDLFRYQDNKYDLVIILDSSSGLANNYLYSTNSKNFVEEIKCDVIVIDHHEINITEPWIFRGKYQTVLNCNCLRTKGLENISAGMFAYIIFNDYFCLKKDSADIDTSIHDNIEEDDLLGIKEVYSDVVKNDSIGNIDLYEIGVVTNISDIVPVDEFVGISILYYLLNETLTTDFIKGLASDNNVNVFNLQWGMIPLVNYTRRLCDDSTIELIYKNNIKLAKEYMIENRKKGKNIIKYLKQEAKFEYYRNFIFVDISNQIYLA